jgi:curved DNA-binding protein CbpA
MNEDDIKKISYLDLYEILDISKDNFDIKKLKKNYKKLILRLHPDKTGKDSEAFELVNLAYTILKNHNLKTTYNSFRKLYLQNSTFIDLKKSNNNIHNFPLNKDDALKNYKKLEKELNEKHKFNKYDINKLTTSDLSTRLQNINFIRHNIDEEFKNEKKKKKLNNYDFNEEFLKSSDKDNLCKEITAFNNNLFDISKYNDINNFNLYSEGGSNSSKYSSLDYAFKSLVPNGVINNYNDHNLVTLDDIESYKIKINNYKNNL